MADSREDFIQHFKDTYSDEFPPAWIALQIVSFGALIKLFRNFNNRDLQFQVAKNFGCDSVDRFISWMNTLVYLRNICSHHARLWNRPLKKRPEAYNFGIRNKRWSQQDLAKLYYSICVIGGQTLSLCQDRYSRESQKARVGQHKRLLCLWQRNTERGRFPPCR